MIFFLQKTLWLPKNSRVKRWRGRQSRVPTSDSDFIPRQWRRRSPRPSSSAHVLNMSPFTLRLRLARSPGARQSLGGGSEGGEERKYLCFVSVKFLVFRAESEPPDHLGFWGGETLGSPGPHGNYVSTGLWCSSCRGVELHTARPTRNSDCVSYLPHWF